MTEARADDVIGVEARGRAPRSPVPLLAGVLGIAAGFAAGLLWAQWRQPDPRPVPQPAAAAEPVPRPDGGVVQVCDSCAQAFLFVLGLPPGRTEVHLPLRGDAVLLPVLTEDAQVLTGAPDGSQHFVPEDGQLVIAQRMAVPAGDTVAALVGDQRLTLAVRGCDGGPR